MRTPEEARNFLKDKGPWQIIHSFEVEVEVSLPQDQKRAANEALNTFWTGKPNLSKGKSEHPDDDLHLEAAYAMHRHRRTTIGFNIHADGSWTMRPISSVA